MEGECHSSDKCAEGRELDGQWDVERSKSVNEKAELTFPEREDNVNCQCKFTSHFYFKERNEIVKHLFACQDKKKWRDVAAGWSCFQSSSLMSFLCMLPVTSWSHVSGLAAIAQQFPLFTQEAGGAETVSIKTLLLSSLKWWVNPIALSQHREGQQGQEEEKRTQAG